MVGKLPGKLFECGTLAGTNVRQLFSLLLACGDAVIVTDSDLHIVAMSSDAIALYECEPDEWEGESAPAFLGMTLFDHEWQETPNVLKRRDRHLSRKGKDIHVTFSILPLDDLGADGYRGIIVRDHTSLILALGLLYEGPALARAGLRHSETDTNSPSHQLTGAI